MDATYKNYSKILGISKKEQDHSDSFSFLLV